MLVLEFQMELLTEPLLFESTPVYVASCGAMAYRTLYSDISRSRTPHCVPIIR